MMHRSLRGGGRRRVLSLGVVFSIETLAWAQQPMPPAQPPSAAPAPGAPAQPPPPQAVPPTVAPPPPPPPPPPPMYEAAPEQGTSAPAPVPPPPPAYATPPGSQGPFPVQEPQPPPPPPPSPPDKPGKRGFYARVTAEGVGYFRRAEFDHELGFTVEQTAGGFGYAVWAMLGGSPSRNFSLGGAFVLQHVPKVQVQLDEVDVDSGVDSVLAFTIGPSVDYYPTNVFHVGGLLGISGERVPSFDPIDPQTEGALGTAAALWLGFDWEVGENLGLGVLLRTQFSSLAREVSEADSGVTNADSSLSAGLGASFVYY